MPPARIVVRRDMTDRSRSPACGSPRPCAPCCGRSCRCRRARACGRARSRPSQRGVGQAQPFVAISRPIGISFLASAIISANAPSATVSSAYSGTLTTGMPRAHRGRDIDRVDADAVFDDALELLRRRDDARGDRRVAHQQEVGVAHRRDQLVLADAVGQQHKLAAGRAQARIDLRAFELAVGADRLETRASAQRPYR